MARTPRGNAARPARRVGVLSILARYLWLAPLVAGAWGCSVTPAPRSRPVTETAHLVEGVPATVFGSERCGAGSLSALLAFHGHPITVETLDAELPKAPDGGVLSVDLLLAARRHGLTGARWVEGNEESLRAALLDDLPVILMMRVLNVPGRRGDYFHYVIVDGVDVAADRYRFQFGDGERRWSPMGRRLRGSWRGAGFAMLLSDSPPRG